LRHWKRIRRERGISTNMDKKTVARKLRVKDGDARKLKVRDIEPKRAHQFTFRLKETPQRDELKDSMKRFMDKHS
jgi:hypothetical protein